MADEQDPKKKKTPPEQFGPPAPGKPAMDMNKMVDQSVQQNQGAYAQSKTGGVDPTAQEILKRFSPRRTASDMAQDEVDADRIRASGFGARAGGFATTKPDYHDDPSLSMNQRMEAFNNRTTRAGQQTIGQPQADARGAAGMGPSNVGTPPIPFDMNRITTNPGAVDPQTGHRMPDTHGYDTSGQPSGMLYLGMGHPGQVTSSPGVQPGEVTDIHHFPGRDAGMTPFGPISRQNPATVGSELIGPQAPAPDQSSPDFIGPAAPIVGQPTGPAAPAKTPFFDWRRLLGGGPGYLSSPR